MNSILTQYEKFLQKPENQRVYEQERLLVDTVELIASIMKHRGMKKKELAQKIGRSRSFVTQVLRGNQNLTLRTVADLFYALDYRLAMHAIPFLTDERGTPLPEFELGSWNFTNQPGNCGSLPLQTDLQASAEHEEDAGNDDRVSFEEMAA
jgi:antitoxin component HigA of HigAB toxin-antitoxin module